MRNTGSPAPTSQSRPTVPAPGGSVETTWVVYRKPGPSLVSAAAAVSNFCVLAGIRGVVALRDARTVAPVETAKHALP